MSARRVLLAAVLLCTAAAAGESAGQEPGPAPEWYGFVKLDAAWDDGPIDAGNFARWVSSAEAFEPHAHFNMTARQTRLGFRLRTVLGGASVRGRWEADFYGGGAENKNSLQVRHAYVEVSWPSGWRVLAGQASDVISPLVPGTLNYTVAWWVGNTGYRRPQLRVERAIALGGAQLMLQGAATRTIGDDFVDAEPGDAGSDSGRPTFQGLAGLVWPVGGDELRVGVWTHSGRENLHKVVADDVTLAASGWGGYARLPFGAFAVSGEVWEGSNLDDFLGGVGQGLRVEEDEIIGIGSAGGWVEAALAVGSARIHAGAGVDDPDDGDLAYGARARNTVVWGNVLRDFGGGLTAGIEVSRWRTEYVRMSDGSSLRVQGSVIYTF